MREWQVGVRREDEMEGCEGGKSGGEGQWESADDIQDVSRCLPGGTIQQARRHEEVVTVMPTDDVSSGNRGAVGVGYGGRRASIVY